MEYIFFCNDHEELRSFSDGTTQDCIDCEFDVWAANYEYENKIGDIENLINEGRAGCYKVG